MANLGSDDTPVVADNVRTRVAEIDDTDSPYTTQGENQLEVDTSGGDVTVTIASADIPASGEPGRAVTIVNTAAGSVTIETEGAEQIQPDGVGSLTIETSGAFLDCRLLAGAVYVERNVSRNVIDASAANLTNTTTGQVDGSITSDPITSFTGGELFVNSGVLTFSPGGGPGIRWVQKEGDPVSVQLQEEAVTVPSDEDWLVAVADSATTDQLKINDTVVSENGIFTIRTVLTGGTTVEQVEGSFSKGTVISGFDISNLGVDVVGGINPSVPNDEIWVGGAVGDGVTINGIEATPFGGDTDYSANGWWTLDSGDSVSSEDEDGAWFGAIRR